MPVKKMIPILLMAILLFNWSGYRLLTSWLEDRADDQMETAIDNHAYDESELISIRIPVSYLPYYNNSPGFERVYGQVEIQGLQYNYVKRRIYNDSLELLCIPNHTLTKLNAAKDEFFRFLNDLQHTGANKNGHSRHGSSKTFSTDYYAGSPTYKLTRFPAGALPSAYLYFIALSLRHVQIVEQPPEIA